MQSNGEKLLSFDEVLDNRIGMGCSQVKTLSILVMVDFNDGCQLVIMSFLMTILQHQWGISYMWVAWLTSLFYFGMMLGNFCTGKIADIYGRKPAIFATSILLSIISVLFATIQDPYTMAFFRFLYGVIFGFALPLTSTMLSEIVPSSYRGKGLVFINFFLTVGKVLGCCLAVLCLDNYREGNWRLMFALSGIPPLFVFIGCIFIVKESPRFLVASGQFERAYVILNDMILKNKRNVSGGAQILSEEEISQIQAWQKKVFSTARKGSISALFEGQLGKVTIRVWIIWFLINAMYYGQLVVMPFILGTKTESFLGYFLTLMGEAPSIIVSLYIVDVPCLGRKNSLTLMLFLSMIFHSLCFFVPFNYLSLLASSSRFFMKQSFAMLYPFTAESYPTLLRTIGFGWASGFGRIGAAVIPFMMFALIEVNPFSSFILFGVSSFLGLICSATLPFDTMGRVLDKVKNDDDEIKKKDTERPLLVEMGKKGGDEED